MSAGLLANLMRRAAPIAVVLLTLSVLSSPAFFSSIVSEANASPISFSFGASGDMSSLTVSTGVSNLARLQSVNPNFFIGLGGYSYDPTVTGDTWCGQFKAGFNGIQIIPGDRDTGGHNSTSFGETHSYERYVNGCPLTIGTTLVCGPVQGNCYGKEYYFDYPTGNPIARFILAAPKIYNITGVCTSSPACSSQTLQPCTDTYGCWQYNANDIHFNWVAGAIDDAHVKGIRWVIVATHKLCISASDATCSMGIAFFNMLVQKKVDLIIQAHDNAYERSKQLGFNTSTCPGITTDGNGYAVYNSGCIVDSGLGNYTRGSGTVVVVQGAWINDLYTVDNTNINKGANAAEAPYFVKLMGSNTTGNGLGFTRYTVSANEIDFQTYFSGSFADRFSIVTGPNPAPLESWSPLSPQTGQIVSFTATASGGVAPYAFTWDFGDGDKATGTTASHIYVIAKPFNVTLTAVDSTNHAGSSRRTITVGSWNSAVACSPTVTTVEHVIGNVQVLRNATDPTSIGADYSGGGFKLAPSVPSGSSPQSWPFSKRSFQPPCSVNGVPTFVELHNVTLAALPNVATYDCRTTYDVANGAGPFPSGKNCDVVFSVGNASATTCPACYMHRIYAEIDGDWNASGISPAAPPATGQMIDVQGFVYWDNGSVDFASHNWSGWELHPFTAWRLSLPALTVSIAASPASPSVGGQVVFSVSVSGGTGPYSVSWDFGDGNVATGTSVNHVYFATGTIIVHVGAVDSLGATGVSSQTFILADSPVGSGGRITIR
jgi:PKD domain